MFQNDDFSDYHNSSKMVQFANLPYKTTFQVRFQKMIYIQLNADQTIETLILFKLWSVKKQSWCKSGIHPVKVMENNPELEVKILMSRRQKSDRQECQTAKDDIKSMLKLMLILDRQYYNSVGITENWRSITIKSVNAGC